MNTFVRTMRMSCKDTSMKEVSPMHEFYKDKNDRVWMGLTFGLIMCAAAEVFSPKVEVSIKKDFTTRAEQALCGLEKTLVIANNTSFSPEMRPSIDGVDTQQLLVFVGDEPVGALPSPSKREAVGGVVRESDIHSQFNQLKHDVSEAITKSDVLPEVSLRSYGLNKAKTISLAQPELITESARLSLVQLTKKVQKFWTSKLFTEDQAVEYLPAAKVQPSSREMIGGAKGTKAILLSKHP